jgi:hypothetical protein
MIREVKQMKKKDIEFQFNLIKGMLFLIIGLLIGLITR